MNAKAERIRDYLLGYYPAEEWPCLLSQAEEWAATQPLKGLRILDATPIYRNTLGKYMALLAAGAELYVPATPGMPYDAAIMQLLPGFGIHPATRQTKEFDIILDCAGQFNRLHPVLGFAELTRSGVERLQHTPHPVIVADSGRIKHIETTLGTGEAFFRAMAQLGHADVAGKNLLVVGFGKVGRGIVRYALQNNMHVTVADIRDVRDELPAGVAYVSMDNTEELQATVLLSWCVVTTTGRLHAVRKKIASPAIIQSQVLLANMGVDDEYGPDVPKNRVLNNKRPLNFILEDPTAMRFIETTMALHNACALELLTCDLPHRLLPPPPDVEDRLLRICNIDPDLINDL